jgi:hypothetical protein
LAPIIHGPRKAPQCATASSEAVPCLTAVHCLPCGKQWHTAMNDPGLAAVFRRPPGVRLRIVLREECGPVVKRLADGVPFGVDAA